MSNAGLISMYTCHAGSLTCSGINRLGERPIAESPAAGSGAFMMSLVFRHLRVDLIGPCQNSSGQVLRFAEAGLTQKFDGLGAAPSRAAVDDHVLIGVEFIHSFRQIVQRNEESVEITDLVFI